MKVWEAIQILKELNPDDDLDVVYKNDFKVITSITNDDIGQSVIYVKDYNENDLFSGIVFNDITDKED